MAGRTTLFVYGTLKRGGRNHPLLADQHFLGVAETEPRYRLYDLGPYPGLVRDAASGLAVRGELWAVTDDSLRALDDFEDVPDLYTREPVSVAGHAGTVEAYFWNREPAGPSGAEWPLVARSESGRIGSSGG